MTEPRLIDTRALRSLLGALIRDFRAFGPVDSDGVPAFAPLGAVSELRLDLDPTHLSAREFFLPPKETLLSFALSENENGTKSAVTTAVVEAKEQVLIGLKPCDIHAVALMDSVMAAGVPDVNYQKRRAATIIVGAECTPDDTCFCASLGTEQVKEDSGFDLFIHELKRGAIIRVGTERGAKLLKKYAWGRRATKAELEGLTRYYESKLAAFTAKLNTPKEELPAVLAASDESPVWGEIGALCTGCGACNHVCPTCYCFDVRDALTSDQKSAERYRVWDGCTLDDFTLVAGGHNFRRTRAERLRHRFNRKLNYGVKKFDSLFCVGCGRCSRTCLVGINITEVTNSLIKEARGVDKVAGKEAGKARTKSD
ncbi:MAG: 4Fe-4S dicluster domain-containing protein [Proteobacteria bacterium]|nr:4Fe-4S dicluster domain-containing protein [Pseudomonadota bacterium]